MGTARTTIVIPNYNGARHLAALLPSIAAQTRPVARILVVDNGSTDESRQVVTGRAELITLPENRGFARATNIGIRNASSPFVAIVNNDVVLHPKWLATLEDALDTLGADYAGPLLTTASEPDCIDGAFDLLSRSGCPIRAMNGATVNSLPDSQPSPAPFVPMTAALFRTKLFEDVGALDEFFENYLEDVEFSLRAAAAGAQGLFVPGARATHVGSATLGTWSERATYWNSRNQVCLVARHYPAQLLRRWWWPIFVGHCLYLLLALSRGRFLAAVRGKASAVFAWRSLRATRPNASADYSPDYTRLLMDTILDSESKIAELHNKSTPATYWRWYFRLAPAERRIKP